jgi:hypothetical protein
MLVAKMKSQTDGYDNPFTSAQPRGMGRVIGARHRSFHNMRSGPPHLWQWLEEGQQQDVTAGTVLHVQGPGSRLHRFWFDEAGSLHGPLKFSCAAGADITNLAPPPFMLRLAAAIGFAFVAGIILYAALRYWWMDFAHFSAITRMEVSATVVIGLACIIAWILLNWGAATRLWTKCVLVEPPRTQIL